ncbi:hypothetical protein PIIN_11901 [Serendipita indica DSM 11827]|uniref:Uncharacterized protein n=1 Tax=Serendipita indica (strain DSM 11827) TaxID=1109443 RepID=G4U0R3_SERID|nr:hypothetical protein PIIN_11901 [Serendipita indica DSM 11827]
MHTGRSYEPLSDPECTRHCDQYASDLDEFIQDSNEPPHASPFRIKFDNTLYEDEDEYEEEYDSTAIKMEEAEEPDTLTRLRSFSRPLSTNPCYTLDHNASTIMALVLPFVSKAAEICQAFLTSILENILEHSKINNQQLSSGVWMDLHSRFVIGTHRELVTIGPRATLSRDLVEHVNRNSSGIRYLRYGQQADHSS